MKNPPLSRSGQAYTAANPASGGRLISATPDLLEVTPLHLGAKAYFLQDPVK